MNTIQGIFDQMQDYVRNPKQTIQNYVNKTGNKAIGCFPVYCPEEIVHAAGMLPVGVWGGDVEISLAKKYLPAFACSIMQSNLELGLNGYYDQLTAVIIPALCDTLKCIGQNWKHAIPQVEFIYLVYPQNRKMESGVKFLQSQYQSIRKRLEVIAGHEITDEAINKSITVYNEHRQAMREFSQTAEKYPHIITPSKRHLVMKSAHLMEKSKHTEYVKKLTNELRKCPMMSWNGKKVVVTGILMDSKELHEIFENNSIAIVADDLAQESRQFRVDVPDGNEPLDRLARLWSDMKGCSLAFDSKKKRGQILIDKVKDAKADALVVLMMKFCEPEEFDYPIYKKEFEDVGIPVLCLEIEQQMQHTEQISTRIQAFSEMLKSR